MKYRKKKEKGGTLTVDNALESHVRSLIDDHPCNRRHEPRCYRLPRWFLNLTCPDVGLYTSRLLGHDNGFFLPHLARLFLHDLFVLLDLMRLHDNTI